MEKVDHLLTGSLEKRFGPPGHKKGVVLQLGGSECLERVANEGYTFHEVNLNCGCPSIETGGAMTYGASLMKQPELTQELLQSIVSTVECKVSLKCRIAVLESMDEIKQAVDYTKLHAYVQHASDAGIDHLVLHARPAVLAGLNPTKNRQVPQLDYAVVGQIAHEFPDLKVTLNGGIQTLGDLEEIMKQDDRIASHMARRWMLRRPLDLAQVQSRFFGETDKCLAACINEYAGYIERILHSRYTMPLSELCLPLHLTSEQLQEDFASLERDESGPFLQEEDYYNVYDAIKNAVELMVRYGGKSKKEKALSEYTNFKKLSASFKGLVGTKVANKWKRNRLKL